MSFEIATLVQTICKRGEHFNQSDPNTKQALLQSARNLVAALEPTHETVLRILTNAVCQELWALIIKANLVLSLLSWQVSLLLSVRAFSTP